VWDSGLVKLCMPGAVPPTLAATLRSNMGELRVLMGSEDEPCGAELYGAATGFGLGDRVGQSGP